MTDTPDAPPKKPSALRDVSGTTVALTSLAVMAAAAVVSAPVWFYYRSKRRRAEALVAEAQGAVAPERATDAAPPAPPDAKPE